MWKDIVYYDMQILRRIGPFESLIIHPVKGTDGEIEKCELSEANGYTLYVVIDGMEYAAVDCPDKQVAEDHKSKYEFLYNIKHIQL